MTRIPILPVLFVSLVLVASSGAHAETGAYAGTGPSRETDQFGNCWNDAPAHVALVPGGSVGTWSLQVEQVYAYPIAMCNGLAQGWASWPGLVVERLVGAPATGIVGAGQAEEIGTSPGHVHWDVTILPFAAVGPMIWSIHTHYVPDPDPYGFGPQDIWWNGTALIAGASG